VCGSFGWKSTAHFRTIHALMSAVKAFESRGAASRPDGRFVVCLALRLRGCWLILAEIGCD
jgi:hypothetical protein